jgi:hypothetical protein
MDAFTLETRFKWDGHPSKPTMVAALSDPLFALDVNPEGQLVLDLLRGKEQGFMFGCAQRKSTRQCRLVDSFGKQGPTQPNWKDAAERYADCDCGALRLRHPSRAQWSKHWLVKSFSAEAASLAGALRDVLCFQSTTESFAAWRLRNPRSLRYRPPVPRHPLQAQAPRNA